MPTELRHIVFSAEEAFTAVKEYRRRRREPLPDGTLERFAIWSNPDIRAEFDIGSDGQLETVGADRDELATALIMYCIDHRIPIPVKSSKFLQVFGESPGLVITKNLSFEKIETG